MIASAGNPVSDLPFATDPEPMKLASRILLRFLRWLAVTVWFGIFFLALPVFLLAGAIHDPRDILPSFFGAFGCYMMIAGWLWITIHFAIYDRMPDAFD